MSTPTLADLDAVTFDAMGTLIQLREPGPLLRAALVARYGIEAPSERCAAAMHAEISHYVLHAAQARTPSDAARLRLECAAVVAEALSVGLDAAEALPLLGEAIRYEPTRGAAATLATLRQTGIRLAVVSNFDTSLARVLAVTDLAEHFELVLSTAELGIRKPDPAVYTAAAERLGSVPQRLVHVGDDPRGDVDAALAAGYRAAVLIDPRPGPAKRRPRIAAIPELLALLDADRQRITGERAKP